MTKHQAAYLAIHDFFGRNGEAAWDLLRRRLGDSVTNALVDHFANAHRATLQEAATRAAALAQTEWEAEQP